MSDTSPILALPLIQPSQAQKHITHNEALRLLDAVVQLVVISASLGTPPAGATAGDRYIVAASSNGAWTDHVSDIAVFADGGWSFIVPQAGWCAQVLNPKGGLVFDATMGWEAVGGMLLQDIREFGINASADATNRLTLSAPATLLNHEGAGHQLKLNKAGLGDTASLLYQSAFSGRAEIGLAGNNDLTVKVSADGEAWREALKVDAASGSVAAPRGLESVQVTVDQNTVTVLTPPSPGGFAFISSAGSNSSQDTTSMVLCYDVGSAPQVLTIWSGSDVVNLGTVVPTGTTVPVGKVGVSAQNNGTLYLENRHGSGGVLQYCITWINSWRPV